MRQPTLRPRVYDTYWRFAAERQAIFHKRARGAEAPWTEDPILDRFKFCNTYRASDRVSQYLIRDVIYGPYGADLPAEDAFFRIVFFRLFSKEATWDALEAATGGVRLSSFDPDRLGDLLDELRRQQSIYTSAFILCANSAYAKPSKHRNHLALLEDMFVHQRFGQALGKATSLQEVYERLLAFPLLGPFMAYQLAVDLNYSPHLLFDENDFTMPGPGAIRGLRKVFSDFGSLTPQQLILHMVDRQQEEFDRLGLDFQDLFGRPLHAIDCQGLFCETDKYSRERFPELKSNRVRIKQQFRPAGQPADLFYPPHWNINHLVPGAKPAEPAAERAGGQLALLPA